MSAFLNFIDRLRCKLLHRRHMWRHPVHHSQAWHCDYCGNQWIEDDL